MRTTTYKKAKKKKNTCALISLIGVVSSLDNSKKSNLDSLYITRTLIHGVLYLWAHVNLGLCFG